MRIKTFKVFESRDEISSNIENILIDIKDEYDYVDINIQHSDPYIFVLIDFDKSDKLKDFDMIKYQKVFDRLVQYMTSDGYKYEVRFFKRKYDPEAGIMGKTRCLVDISENPTEIVFTFEQDSIKESLGIDKDIESQAKNLFKQISNSFENEFSFPIYDDKGNYFFKLIIDKKIKSDGTFQVDDKEHGVKIYTIFIKDRKDYSTLLHELKHLSLYLKSKGKSFQDKVFKSWGVIRSKKGTPLDIAESIFYVYNQDEFESKYHSYYVDIDNYIKVNLKSKATKEEINRLIKECLNKHSDLSYTWWVGYFNGKESPKDFKFSTYLNNENINRLLYSILKSDHVYKFDGIYLDTIVKGFKKLLSHTNFYTKSDKIKMEKLRKEYEKLINERKIRFKKRFYRLFTIMQEKYIQNETPKNIRKFPSS